MHNHHPRHHHRNKLKLLFLLKENNNYGDEYNSSVPNRFGKSGLRNSAYFVCETLKNQFNIETKLEFCIDGNDIDRRLHKYKPNVCFIEAIWVTGKKMQELSKLYPNILFIIRVHSRTTFLANEGEAIRRIKEYDEIRNVYVSFNNKTTNDEFRAIGIKSIYLPNIYHHVCPPFKKTNIFQLILSFFLGKNQKYVYKNEINIGCFGAIRPMKNQLLQAIAAIRFGEEFNKHVKFHINATRTEQKGENVLKNIRALFEGSDHELVEHDWLEHEYFLKLISTMDIGLQVSLSESFNIVTADFVSQKVPIIVSDKIAWAADISKVETENSKQIANKIDDFLQHPNDVVKKNLNCLSIYNDEAIEEWKGFLKEINYFI